MTLLDDSVLDDDLAMLWEDDPVAATYKSFSSVAFNPNTGIKTPVFSNVAVEIYVDQRLKTKAILGAFVVYDLIVYLEASSLAAPSTKDFILLGSQTYQIVSVVNQERLWMLGLNVVETND